MHCTACVVLLSTVCVLSCTALRVLCRAALCVCCAAPHCVVHGTALCALCCTAPGVLCCTARRVLRCTVLCCALHCGDARTWAAADQFLFFLYCRFCWDPVAPVFSDIGWFFGEGIPLQFHR